ncbi:hypothetical protein NQ317_003617 [Molorchus minor]|uniref:Uncharacterized protein n=1 Tax=Molorchus minor TaxID=1323400 RepID=A0ABQ9JI92_9CUCU|nr:hypothetical protein NQ317_003617 [Molorchus minor]
MSAITGDKRASPNNCCEHYWLIRHINNQVMYEINTDDVTKIKDELGAYIPKCHIEDIFITRVHLQNKLRPGGFSWVLQNVTKVRPNDKIQKMKYTECNKMVKKIAFEKAISVEDNKEKYSR